jgi:predicted protein tyrosine phosphatase
MRIEIANRFQIECGYCPTQKSILISITAPDVEHPRHSRELIDVLQLNFHDTDKVSYGLVAPSIEHGRQIVDFVNKHKDTVDCIVVNCDAGQSRSAGVAAGISLCLNGSDQEIFNRKPLLNRRAYRCVLAGFEECDK